MVVGAIVHTLEVPTRVNGNVTGPFAPNTPVWIWAATAGTLVVIEPEARSVIGSTVIRAVAVSADVTGGTSWSAASLTSVISVPICPRTSPPGNAVLCALK